MFENCSCHTPNPSQDENVKGVKQSACKPCSAKTVKMMLASLGGIVLIVVVLTQWAWSAPASAQTAGVALEVYCPICVTQMGKWVKGNPEHHATYDGKTYYFPSEREREMFLTDPAKYVPALGGDCTVCYAKAGKRVAGNIRHAALHGGHLYLFPSDKEKQAFLANPAEFADVDLALNGNCAVCLAKAGKKVPGKPEFTAIHNGFRYQFPSDRERRAFLASPEQFAAGGDADRRLTLRPVSARHEQLHIEGRSGCAGCEYGVTPIGAPDTLGLAVTTRDGNVYVIEDAHRLYPQVYKDRFSGIRLSVSGDVVKQDGKITWLRPANLSVIN